MSIFIKELSNNKFEITVNKKLITKHTVSLTDEYYDILTKKKISKKAINGLPKRISKKIC